MSDEICACCGNRKGCDCYSPQGALQRQLSEAQARIAALQEQAAFGLQCFQDRCENALVEQSVVTRQLAERDQRIAELEGVVTAYRAWRNSMPAIIGDSYYQERMKEQYTRKRELDTAMDALAPKEASDAE